MKFLNDAFTRMNAFELAIAGVLFAALCAICVCLGMMATAKLIKRIKSKRLAKSQPRNMFKQDRDVAELKDGVTLLTGIATVIAIIMILTCGK